MPNLHALFRDISEFEVRKSLMPSRLAEVQLPADAELCSTAAGVELAAHHGPSGEDIGEIWNDPSVWPDDAIELPPTVIAAAGQAVMPNPPPTSSSVEFVWTTAKHAAPRPRKSSAHRLAAMALIVTASLAGATSLVDGPRAPNDRIASWAHIGSALISQAPERHAPPIAVEQIQHISTDVLPSVPTTLAAITVADSNHAETTIPWLAPSGGAIATLDALPEPSIPIAPSLAGDRIPVGVSRWPSHAGAGAQHGSSPVMPRRLAEPEAPHPAYLAGPASDPDIAKSPISHITADPSKIDASGTPRRAAAKMRSATAIQDPPEHTKPATGRSTKSAGAKTMRTEITKVGPPASLGHGGTVRNSADNTVGATVWLLGVKLPRLQPAWAAAVFAGRD